MKRSVDIDAGAARDLLSDLTVSVHQGIESLSASLLHLLSESGSALIAGMETKVAAVVFALLPKQRRTDGGRGGDGSEMDWSQFGSSSFVLTVEDMSALEGGELRGYLRYDASGSQMSADTAASTVAQLVHLHEAAAAAECDWKRVSLEALLRFINIHGVKVGQTAAGSWPIRAAEQPPPPPMPAPTPPDEAAAPPARATTRSASGSRSAGGSAAPNGHVVSKVKACAACRTMLYCQAGVDADGDETTHAGKLFFAYDRVFCTEYCQQRFIGMAAESRQGNRRTSGGSGSGGSSASKPKPSLQAKAGGSGRSSFYPT